MIALIIYLIFSYIVELVIGIIAIINTNNLANVIMIAFAPITFPADVGYMMYKLQKNL